MNQEFWENAEFSRYLQDIDPEDVRKLSSFFLRFEPIDLAIISLFLATIVAGSFSVADTAIIARFLFSIGSNLFVINNQKEFLKSVEELRKEIADKELEIREKTILNERIERLEKLIKKESN